MSNVINIDGFNYPTATIRKDLINKSVPVGDAYYSGKQPLPYRWKGEDFQVYLFGTWYDAESIDWDFE